MGANKIIIQSKGTASYGNEQRASCAEAALEERKFKSGNSLYILILISAARILLLVEHFISALDVSEIQIAYDWILFEREN